jgi:hypothetical protein
LSGGITDAPGGSGRSGGGIEGGGGWRPPFGPPARPTCDIAVSGRGVITGGVDLTFPDGSRRRGRSSRGLQGVIVPGWFWNIEIFARVSDNVANWTIHQELTAYFIGTWRDKKGFQDKPIQVPYPHDEPPEGYFKKIPGHTWLFWIDTPGLALYSTGGIEPINLTIVFVGQSWIQQGRNKCSVGWLLTLVWENGVLVESQSFFRPDRESF